MFCAALGFLLLRVKPVYVAETLQVKNKHIYDTLFQILQRDDAVTCFALHAVSITVLSRSTSSAP